MASKVAHNSTGWAAGIIAAALVTSTLQSDPYHMWALLTLLAGVSGGTAPDWIELAWWRTGRGHHTWLKHRTWTHWGIAWIALLVYSYVTLEQHSWHAVLFGFAAGGVMHLLADWPNPLGVPWLWVYQRHSLNLWKSGRCDRFVTMPAWGCAVAIADKTWFQGEVTRQTCHFVKFAIVPEILVLLAKISV